MIFLKRTTLAAILAAFVAVATPTLAAQMTLPATVVDVIDGDTLRVDTANCEHCRVRMLEIDAPEHDQPYGKAARKTLSTLVNGVGATVQLATEGKDQYGRLLAYVYQKGRNINWAMVDEGAAWVYDQYSNSALPRKLEDQARHAKRGLWALAEDKRMPPWQWRHESKDAANKMASLIAEFVNGMKDAAVHLGQIIIDQFD